MRVAVTGGAGYLGALVVDELLRAGHDVLSVDVLLHGQREVAASLEASGAGVVRGDIRDPGVRRSALQGRDAVVHLAGIVGDPACRDEPLLSRQVNVEASRALIAEARQLDVQRVVFASTCSNYGRMEDPTVPVDEAAPLRPLSLYAKQKVAIERALLRPDVGLASTCLRFATLYGLAPRMRFDLTVNEFTRDLWAGRQLDVYGELFWRPYIHVRDGARAVAAVLDAPASMVESDVFNVGHSDENYRKLDLVELIRERVGSGEVKYVHRDEDPRDYKVSFEKIRSTLGFEPDLRVSDGIAEIVRALEAGLLRDPFHGAFSNV